MKLSFQAMFIHGLLLMGLILLLIWIAFQFSAVSRFTSELNRQVDSAHTVVGGVVYSRLNTRERLDRAREMLLLVRESKNILNEQRGRINQVFLSNGSLITEDMTISQQQILQLVEVFHDDVLVRPGELGSWREQIREQATLLHNQYAWIKQHWVQRHEGLREELLQVRRHYIYWALKIANMLFIQSSIDELVPAKQESTQLRVFMRHPRFSIWQTSVPHFKTHVPRAISHDAALFHATQELDDLTLRGKWDEARILYRDKFPPLTKALGVRLDYLISNEEAILEQQRQCERRAKEYVDPVFEQISTTLNQLSEKTEQFILRAQSEVINTQQHVQSELRALDGDLKFLIFDVERMLGQFGRLQLLAVLAGVVASLFVLSMAFTLLRSHENRLPLSGRSHDFN